MRLAIFTTLLYGAACAIHEAGHALPAAWYGLPWRVRFGWLGPQVHVTGRWVRHENAAVALGGPVASVLGAVAVWFAGLPACAVIVGIIGALNILDVVHAVQYWNGIHNGLLEAIKVKGE